MKYRPAYTLPAIVNRYFVRSNSFAPHQSDTKRDIRCGEIDALNDDDFVSVIHECLRAWIRRYECGCHLFVLQVDLKIALVLRPRHGQQKACATGPSGPVAARAAF